MEQGSLLFALFSLKDSQLRFVLAVLEKVNGLELLSERFSHSLEKELKESSGFTYNECLLKLLQRLNTIVRNESIQFAAREDLVHNLNVLVKGAIDSLQKNEKGFQGDKLLDLLVFEEEIFSEVSGNTDAKDMQGLLLRIFDKSDLMVKTFAGNKLREKILPFLLYYIFKQGVGEEDEIVEERISAFLSYWGEKKGIYDQLHVKWEELNYSIELEERLLEQKQNNVRNLQQQLDEMNEEIDKIKKIVRHRIPMDARKLEGFLEGKARIFSEKIAILEEEERLASEKNHEKKGILHNIWSRIDQGFTGIQLEKEIKKLSGQLLDELLLMKKDLVYLPPFYVDRIKMILENERRIQENRRWRYQLEKEIEAHQEVIKHHKNEQKGFVEEINKLEKEILISC